MHEKTLLNYWLVLYKRKTVILFITAISIVTVIILGALLPPVYEARALFYVPSSSQALNFMSTSMQGFARDKLVPLAKEDDAGPYIGLLKSKTIAEYVHKEIPQKSLRKLLLSDVDFELSNEFILTIYSRDKDPVIAANVANAYLKYVNLMLQDASLKNPDQDSLLINNQLSEVWKNLEDARHALKNFAENNNIASIDEEIKGLTNQRLSFQSQLENTLVLINENEEKIKSLIEQLKKEGTIIAENDFMLTNSSIEYLQKLLSDQAAEIAAASIEYKESHVELKRLKNKYNETFNRLRKEVQNLVSSQIKDANTLYEKLRTDLTNLTIDKNKLQATQRESTAVINRINERLYKLPSINAEWSKLNENVERFKKIYEQLKMNLKETELQQARPIQYVVVVDYAKPPESPAFPILWVNIIVALLFGLSGGVFYAFFIDYIETTRKVRTLKLIKTVLSKEKD